MALIKCPECGKELSDQALNCPNCGAPMHEVQAKAEKAKKVNNTAKIITWVCIILGGLLGAFAGCSLFS